MKNIELNQIKVGGELAERCEKLFERLETNDYSVNEVFSERCAAAWPGDWVGRAILGQTLISQVTGKKSENLAALIAFLPEHFNEKGYLGEIYPKGVANEQQLSGHSWLLRGLCEYYKLTGEKSILDMAQNIVNELFLPLSSLYDAYPIERENKAEGEMSGNISNTVNGWMLSTDILCAYIPLDGITSVYELTGDIKTGEMAEKLAHLFAKVDLISIKAQTHATLTATRAFLRMYGITQNTFYLNCAKRFFNLYTDYGMTDSFENFNWFCRDSWTEPCAVIDSFITAMQLYQYTAMCDYIDYGQKILYNGIFNEQRDNGGFGCNSCATDGIISCKCYEASWCCTMRGGEGLSKAVQYSYFIHDNRIIVPYLSNSELDVEINGEKLRISQSTSYPYDGKATFDISGLTENSDVYLVIYQPREGEYYTKKLTPTDCHIDISFTIPMIVSQNKDGKKIYRHGNLIIGCNEEDNPNFSHIVYRTGGVYYCGECKMSPLGGNRKLDTDSNVKSRVRIAF